MHVGNTGVTERKWSDVNVGRANSRRLYCKHAGTRPRGVLGTYMLFKKMGALIGYLSKLLIMP